MSTADIAILRAQTGAGMLDCKKALDQSGGDMDQAIDWLRKRGIAKAAKRADKIAAEGVVLSYIHAGGKVGVLLEINCETDFVAKTDQFQELVKDIALHVAAAAPRYISRDEVPSEMVEKEKDIYRVQLKNEGKPADMIEKIIDGKLGKFYSEICLLEQPFIKNDEKTIADLLTAKTGEMGEKIRVRRFARFVLGEGILKEEKNFVDEVAAQIS